MLNFSQTTLNACIVHRVGNKTHEGPLVLSRKKIDMDGQLEYHLVNYFLRPFRQTTETHTFHHEIDLDLNVLNALSKQLFTEGKLAPLSAAMAKHLYDQGRYSAIKEGDFFVALFSDIVMGENICRGIGLFKSENQDDFLHITEEEKNLGVQAWKGINQKRLDKGCLILDDESEEGFKVFTWEHNGADTEYWRKDFLAVRPLNDEHYQTRQFMDVCRNFVKDRLSEEFEVTKADQIDMLNKSVEYFKENTHFKLNDFAEQVFEHEDVAKSFKQYKKEFQQEASVEMDNSFAISAQAVKKQSRHFKSVLKLDKNFHVYIHGDRNLIEQGVEQDGRKYYKIYFNEEQ